MGGEGGGGGGQVYTGKMCEGGKVWMYMCECVFVRF